MPKIIQHIFNRKTLGSIINNITLKSLIEHAQPLDIKQIIDNWCSLIEQKSLEDKSEISLQDSFLSNIFGRILDYKLIHESPETYDEWHLYREKKTITDSTRSDAALGFFSPKNEDVRVIVELKDAKTRLDAKQKRKGANYTPIEQAFLYSGKFSKKCKWIIVSNYKEIRLYNRSASMNEYEAFFIERLKDETELKRFFYLLSRKNLIAKEKDSIIDRLYSSNEAEQEKISKDFYKKYKDLRIHIFEHLKQNNSNYEELILLEKTQKLLDRFIFICYCEDLGLLPERIFKKMMEAITNPMIFADISRWDQLKNLFRAIDQGSPPHNINKFNGGLFEFDEILDDKLIIGDEVFKGLAGISDYDFDSELNVNILGHIFEQSISDIEEIKSSLAGESFDKKKGKRKKDGIYYTPEYITRYIVEQTVGGWLEDRKKELGFERLPELTEKDFASIKYYTKKAVIKTSNQNIKDHLEFWRQYKITLSNIRVLDPACGSGAFLNQAFDYLYKEGQYVNEQLAKLEKAQVELFKLDEHILKNNLFGVDLNPESVEITKLSLWLKTADKNSELTSLDKNIKCGNSLIDDPEIAGDRAFKWKDEFTEIMRNGGFDVVVGNPPYVPTESIIKTHKNYFEKNYTSAYGRVNIYPLFYEKAIRLSKQCGYIGFISPYTLLKNQYYIEVRRFILKKTIIKKLVDFKNVKVFEDAVVDSIILILKKCRTKKNEVELINVIDDFQLYEFNIKYLLQSEFMSNDDLSFNIGLTSDLTDKLYSDTLTIGEVINFNQGIITGGNKKFISDKSGKQAKKIITGKDFNRYSLSYNNLYIIYDTELLHRPRKREIFEVSEKILLRQTGSYPICTIDYNRYYTLDTVHIGLIIDNRFNIKYLLGLLNSNLLRFLYEQQINESGKVFAQVKIIYINLLPIKIVNRKLQQPFINRANTMLSKNKELHEVKTDFLNFLKSELKPKTISKKLEKWPELDWDQFKAELTKCKVKIKNLSLKERKEWQVYFTEQKPKAAEIKAIIDSTDREIDRMVYELYGLTQEEIQIVENATFR